MKSSKGKIPRNSPKAKYLATASIRRRAGGAIKSFEYSQYESKKLGKVGRANKGRLVEVTPEDQEKYLQLLEAITK